MEGASAIRSCSCILQVIAEKVDKPRDIEFKGATDLVTDTDKASEEAVLSVSSITVYNHSSLASNPEPAVAQEWLRQAAWALPHTISAAC